MKGFHTGRRGSSDLETELRTRRPEPRARFLESLADDVRSEGRRSRGSFRVAFAGALTAVMLAALASVGGLGYAASGTTHAVKAVKQAVAPAKTKKVKVVKKSAAQSQYKPGCGLGDKNHTHTGPPGQGGVCPAKGGPKK